MQVFVHGFNSFQLRRPVFLSLVAVLGSANKRARLRPSWDVLEQLANLAAEKGTELLDRVPLDPACGLFVEQRDRIAVQTRLSRHVHTVPPPVSRARTAREFVVVEDANAAVAVASIFEHLVTQRWTPIPNQLISWEDLLSIGGVGSQNV